VIIQFKVPYQISELTQDLQNKIATAVANVIGLNASSVSLTFVEVDMRRRALLEKGLLVNVGLKDVQGSAAPFASRLTQDSINTQMGALGLRSVTSVTLVSQAATNSTQSSIKPGSGRAATMLPGGALVACTALAASLLATAFSWERGGSCGAA
jgi:hypothetical protein